MEKKETVLASSMVKVEISIDEKNYAKLRIYPLNAQEICKALVYCNTVFEQVQNLEDFIVDFISYISESIESVDENYDGYYRSVLDPLDIMVNLNLNLGCLEYPVSRIKEIAYIEEQWVNFDLRYNLGKISATSIIICAAIALVRKAMQWDDMWWKPNYE